MTLLEKIQDSARFLSEKMGNKSKVAIVLGSGLGGLVDYLKPNYAITYKEIPHFPVSTVRGHSGTLIQGTLNGVEVLVMNGRFHYYEGYAMQEVTFPIRVFKAMGIKHVILSNAAGGMNPTFNVGDVMLIKDHINFFGTNPLLGHNEEQLGPRFPDMSEAYSREMIQLAKKIAEEHQISLQQGVYVGVTGPCFETPAEYRMFNILGGDAVGMSTVPETIVARHGGMQVFALSVITDLGVVGMVEKVSHEEVLHAAEKAGPKMVKLIYEMLPQL
ncbi:MAG: purine-nucleoside phosphorylase [Bacteroidales bacterium]|jgi:purine-nucleoside phosphorylase|nr:purine-nucleoside phosphorylase [Bacteroidales bacterium]